MPTQSACSEILERNEMADVVNAAAATCPGQTHGQWRCPDKAELCRGWGFQWDDKRQTCTVGGH